MRIIEIDEKERIHKCSWCKSKLAYNCNDIFENIFYKKAIKCPICGMKQKISMFDKKVK